MDKKQNADLQSAIMQKIDLSRQMSEEEVREIIDEQIKQESKKHCLEVTAREQGEFTSSSAGISFILSGSSEFYRN